jgi:hypothetical protein
VRAAGFAAAALLFVAGAARADAPPTRFVPPPPPPATDETIVVQPPPEAAKPEPSPPAPPPSARPPSYVWKPNSGVMTAGTAIFLAGYGPAFAAGAPSAVGLVGRVFGLVFTLGLPCILNENGTSSYLCEADHGAMILLVPIAGPFLFVETHPHDTFINRAGRELSPVSTALLYTSGAAQAVGASVMVTAFALGGDTPATPPRPGPNHSLLMAGLLTFASAYGEAFVFSTPSLAIGAAEAITAVENLGKTNPTSEKPLPIAGAELAIPIVGPFLFAATDGRDVALNPNGSLSPTAKTLLYVDGAFQIAGGALMLAALADTAPAPKDFAVGIHAPKLQVLPLVAPGAMGLSVGVSSW